MIYLQKFPYDIFISYRREGGFETASLIAEKLRSAGYHVFLDVESLRSGKFNEQLYAVIEQCKDFIVVLPKDGLERCHNETDWLRREVIHAIKHNKNVIPVMLKGFVWSSEMPAGMEELGNFQGVAAGDYNYFDAAMDKLKSYLKSKKRFAWQKYKKYNIAALILFSLIAGIFAWTHYNGRQHYTKLCIEQVNSMSMGIGAINHNLNIAKDAHDEWNTFFNKLRSKPNDISKIKQDFISSIENKKKSIQSANPELRISDKTAAVLTRNGVKTSEITAFYSSVLPKEVEEASQYLEKLQQYAGQEMLAEIFDRFAHLNYQFLEASGKSIYYYFLGLLSTMPKDVYKDFYKMRQHLNHFSEISTEGSYDEFESLGDAMLKNAENIVMMMGSVVNTADRDTEELQNQLDDIMNMMENKKASEEEIATRLNNLVKKSAELGAKQQKLQDAEKQMEDSYRRLFEKCELQPDDDQYMMWGKILRLASVMDMASKSRKDAKIEADKEKADAIAQGVDVSDWYEVQYTITTRDMLHEIHRRLDTYLSYFADTREYVPAVKQFYAMVENNQYPLGSIVVVGTKDNLPHPVLKVGDILLKRKGININNVDDYKKAKETPGDDVLTFLRLNANGRLNLHQEITPPTDVLTGFLNLREED